MSDEISIWEAGDRIAKDWFDKLIERDLEILRRKHEIIREESLISKHE